MKRLEINAAEQQKTLNLIINNRSYRLGEVGAGMSQFIVVLGNAAIRRPSFVLIDEPELNLHPALQIDFLTSLTSFATNGVIFATHSIGLARTTAEHIYSFQRKSGAGTIVRAFEQTPNYTEFVGEMSFAAFREMGCDVVLLVEGVTDVKAIQQLLRKYKKDHRIVMIPLGGDQLARGNVEAELSELTRLSANLAAIMDSERESEGSDPAPKRQAFAVLCKKIGIRLCLTDRRALENYFTDTAVMQVLGSQARALTPYQRLSEAIKPWDKNVNWRIARAMEMQDIDQTDVGRFLEKL